MTDIRWFHLLATKPDLVRDMRNANYNWHHKHEARTYYEAMSKLLGMELNSPEFGKFSAGSASYAAWFWDVIFTWDEVDGKGPWP